MIQSIPRGLDTLCPRSHCDTGFNLWRLAFLLTVSTWASFRVDAREQQATVAQNGKSGAKGQNRSFLYS